MENIVLKVINVNIIFFLCFQLIAIITITLHESEYTFLEM